MYKSTIILEVFLSFFFWYDVACRTECNTKCDWLKYIITNIILFRMEDWTNGTYNTE